MRWNDIFGAKFFDKSIRYASFTKQFSFKIVTLIIHFICFDVIFIYLDEYEEGPEEEEKRFKVCSKFKDLTFF